MQGSIQCVISLEFSLAYCSVLQVLVLLLRLQHKALNGVFVTLPQRLPHVESFVHSKG
jgi:hypothetical protein